MVREKGRESFHSVIDESPLGFLSKNFFLIGPSPANLYAPHLYFYTTRLKNSTLSDLTTGPAAARGVDPARREVVIETKKR